MHITRITIILCLILAIALQDNSFVRKQASPFWEDIRSDVVEVMDGLYAALRNFVAGSDSHEGIEGDSSEEDYERVITMDHLQFAGS